MRQVGLDCRSDRGGKLLRITPRFAQGPSFARLTPGHSLGQAAKLARR